MHNKEFFYGNLTSLFKYVNILYLFAPITDYDNSFCHVEVFLNFFPRLCNFDRVITNKLFILIYFIIKHHGNIFVRWILLQKLLCTLTIAHLSSLNL